jgi:hypothetical protein
VSARRYRWNIQQVVVTGRFRWSVYDAEVLGQRAEDGQAQTYIGARFAIWRRIRKFDREQRRRAFRREGEVT